MNSSHAALQRFASEIHHASLRQYCKIFRGRIYSADIMIPPATLPRLRLSIVIPHYNHAHEVKTALAAIYRQSVLPDEVILVDDASTPEMFDELNRVSKQWPNLQVLRHQINQGVNVACNTGLAAVTGDYVLFTAADDQLDPKMLERIAAAADGIEGMLFSDPSEASSDGTGRRVYPLYLGNGSGKFDPSSFQKLLRENFFFLSVATVWFNVSRLRAIGGFDPKLRWHADYFASYAVGMRAGARYVPGALSYFTVASHSYSAIGYRSNEQIDVIRYWLEILKRPENASLRKAFVDAALLPEYSLRSLRVVVSDPSYLTPRLIGRILLRTCWNFLRPFAPLKLRNFMRRTASGRTTLP